tara:strand:+ start:54 stop:545 length:492 start_codon:yes stop_codon:yes gene_type:complete
MEKKFSGLVADLGSGLPTHGQMFDYGREDDKEFFKNQVQSPTTIFSSNQALPAIGQFLGQANQQGVFDDVKDKGYSMLKSFVNNRFSSNKDNEVDNVNTNSVTDKFQNFKKGFNKLNDFGIDLNTSGIGFSKEFKDENKFLRGSINQQFGGDTSVNLKAGITF